MPNGATNWITVAQASEQTGYSEQYVRRLCRQGKLKSERVAGALLIEPDSLKNYVDTMRSLGTGKYNWRRE